MQALGTLFIVALFLERSLDTFFTPTRSKEAEALDQEISALEKRQSGINDDPNPASTDKQTLIEQLQKDLDNKKSERFEHRAKTRNIATVAGLIIGLFISAIGLRILNNFVNLNIPKDRIYQKNLFNLVDVFLTGGLIAGGSDNIHKITEVYRSFIEKKKSG